MSDLSHKSSKRLIAKQGLEQESIFNGEVYLRMQGNTSGPVVVLVHGLGDDASKIWDATIRKLEQQYFVVTFDLPGFGRSSKSNELYSPENYVAVIHELTQKYIQKPFHLVGHSMGGAISLRYSETYPNDVNTLTLIDAAGILHRLAYTKYLAPLGLKAFSKFINFDNNDVTSLAGLILNKLDSFMTIDLKTVIRNPSLRSTVLQGNPSLISAMALVLDDFSLIPQNISAKTQIIWGRNDSVAPLRTAYVLDALIPNSSLQIIEDAGHVPIRETPDAFHQLLVDGLESTTSDRTIPDQPQVVEKLIRCNNQNNVSYSGIINTLVIDNCKNVSIINAKLNNLIINNSRAYVNNVKIRSPNTALKVRNSTVEITATILDGEIAIDVDQSRLDIAGSRLIGKQDVIITSSNQANNAVFSLVSISNSQYQNKILHGLANLTTVNN